MVRARPASRSSSSRCSPTASSPAACSCSSSSSSCRPGCSSSSRSTCRSRSGLSAIDTGLRIMPLSITLLLAAAGIPRFFPNASPRRVVRLGLLVDVRRDRLAVHGAWTSMRVPRSSPSRCCSLGLGHRRARLAARQRHRVGGARRRERRGRRPAEHRDQPRRVPRHGARRVDAHRDAHVVVPGGASPTTRPSRRACPAQASVELAGGHPVHLRRRARDGARATRASAASAANAIVDENSQARLDGLRSALAVLALLALLGLFFTGRIPAEQPGSQKKTAAVEA